MPGTVPADVERRCAAPGGPPPAGLSADEQRAYEQLIASSTKGLGYAHRDGGAPADAVRDRRLARRPGRLDARPRRDSSTDSSPRGRRGPTGPASGNLTRDEVLDNITLYWLTNTGVSSARLYWENKLGFFDVKGVTIPVAVTVFPSELYQAPRSWTEQAYPNLIYFNEVDRGNHFAAWQEPELFAERAPGRVQVAALVERDAGMTPLAHARRAAHRRSRSCPSRADCRRSTARPAGSTRRR